MNRRYFIILSAFIITSVALVNCLTESKKTTEDKNTAVNTKIEQSYQKTGWLSAGKYRTVVYILTKEECKKSSGSEIEEKIKYEAYKHLQKELNPSFDRNTGMKIKKLIDNFGNLVKLDKDCNESNIYFYDIVNNDLESEFMKIKNSKK